MFTGIIESIGIIRKIQSQGANRLFSVESTISRELKVDQSVSHNGACLTVVELENNIHKVIAVAETLEKTNLSTLTPGDLINLERAMTLQKRLDGHMVQGHVDTVGKCTGKVGKDGSFEFTIEFPKEFARLVIEKGSIALNGISLTIFDVTLHSFTVAIIPYTFEHTTMQYLKIGDKVNLEFDLIGKYVARGALIERENQASSGSL